eukprot:scaffold4140_cov178-Ochromonas_danica.AAC.1
MSWHSLCPSLSCSLCGTAKSMDSNSEPIAGRHCDSFTSCLPSRGTPSTPSSRHSIACPATA